jgi:acyl CoA:acetate/3-ketoacid CoA transferase alpha subunit
MMPAPRSKVVSLDEAVSAVGSGADLTLGGFAHSHQPMGFVRALIRRGATDLSLSAVAECWAAEYLAAAGLLRRARMSNFMLEGFGRCHRFSQGVEEGTIAVEDHSHFGMISRLLAGGLGLPYLPVRAMAGTDILAKPGFEPAHEKSRRVPNPFGEDQITVVSALRPDLAVIHAARADKLGNTQLLGPASVIEEQARAAAQVIVTVEELVDTETIRRRPELTLLPGFMVDAVVPLPYGAHPTGVYGYYDHDQPHLAEYYAASRDDGAVDGYLEAYVYGPRDHWAYLDRLGVSRLLRLRVDPGLGYLLSMHAGR